MTYIPYIHSAKSVSRFIPIFRTLLDQHRKNGVAVVKFDPLEMNLALETAIARLRDAANSLLSDTVSFESVDSELLKQVWPLYRVTSDGISVIIESRRTKEVTPIADSAIGTSLAVLRTAEAGFVEDLTAFARLLGQRHLRGQVDIIGDLSDSLQHRITSENDVVFIPDGQQKYHMI
jgi:hypothetical protein